jgi:zinc transport system permease protein
VKQLLEILSYDFVILALITGLLLTICCSLLGVNLILKKQAMLADGLSHIGFGAIALGLSLGIMDLYFAIPIMIIATLVLIYLSNNPKKNGDSLIAMVSGLCLAIGIIISSTSGGSNIDIQSYFFGSLLTLTISDLIVSIILFILVSAFYLICYKIIFALTFDSEFVKTSNINASIYNFIFALLTSLVVVISIRLMGALLISAIIVYASANALVLAKSYKQMCIHAIIYSIIGFILGFLLSIIFAFPIGASIVVSNSVIFVVLSVIKKIKSKKN